MSRAGDEGGVSDAAELPSGARAFEVDGARWLARAAGAAAAGTGRHGRAFLVSVLFALEAEPGAPRREALLPRGRLETLYPEELVSLFRAATVLPPPPSRA